MSKISEYTVNKVKETLEKKFHLNTFVSFVNDVLNENFDPQDVVSVADNKYRQYANNITSFKRIGTYKDSDNTLVDILVVTLKKRTTLENARSIQRNLVAGYLGTFTEVKNGAIVAFTSPDSEDWRLSLIRMDFVLDAGKIRKELSPAKRYSYLVGPNENCHTAESRFASLIDSDVQPTLKQLEDLFSVEKVTAKFFDEYRALYELLVSSLKSNHTFVGIADQNHINTENFAKTLLGQIVFLYFVQKKGWLGAGKDESLSSGDRKFLRHMFEQADANGTNYFNDWLEYLFYDALNNPKRKGVNSNYIERFDGQVPFLNGGLFEPKYDWEKTFIIIDNKIFENILDVFDRYNFTVKEDDPLDKEVAIDPEMLGKIFENLLEENLRKGKGTFYTPREIVHYMCKESLINYLLASNPKVDRDEIRKLISWNGELLDDYLHFDPSEISKLDQYLSEIKIVDPACGSGAFLVGMLNEIVKARYLLGSKLGEKKPDLYQLKKSTIQNSIHGVDIDPGAIEIAKLRLWLSLVVDHELDEIEPLPNLDYKIMQGNSLVEELVLGDQTIKLFDENAVKGKIPRKVMKTLFEEDVQASFFDDYEQESILIKLKALQKEYFSQSDPILKRKIRDKIQKIEGDAIKNCVSIEMAKLSDQRKNIKVLPGMGIPPEEYKRLQKIENKENQIFSVVSELEKTGVKPFFLWHLYFYDVFAEKGGFDIVIGNPPYVSIFDMSKEIKSIYKKLYSSAVGAFDIYVLFYELGLNIANHHGVISFITPNKFLSAEYAKELRKYISQLSDVKILVNTSRCKVFDAGVYPIIILFSKHYVQNSYVESFDATDTKNGILIQKISNHSQEELRSNEGFNWTFLIGGNNTIVNKLSKYPKITNVCTVSASFSVDEAYKIRNLISEHKTNYAKKFIVSSNIQKYYIDWKDKKISYLKNRFCSAYISLDNKIISANRIKQITSPKILIAGMTKTLRCFPDTNIEYCAAIPVVVLSELKDSIYYLSGLMNSKLFDYYFHALYESLSLSGGYLRIGSPQISNMPYIDDSSNLKSNIELNVKKLLSTNNQNAEVIKEIDSLVYKLFGLTLEEIDIVDNYGKDKK